MLVLFRPLNSTRLIQKVSGKMFFKILLCWQYCILYIQVLVAQWTKCVGNKSVHTENWRYCKDSSNMHYFQTIQFEHLLTHPRIYSSQTFLKTNILFVKFGPYWDKFECQDEVSEVDLVGSILACLPASQSVPGVFSSKCFGYTNLLNAELLSDFENNYYFQVIPLLL